MIQVSSLAMQFDGKYLFKDVNLKFTKGNCFDRSENLAIQMRDSGELRSGLLRRG